MFNIDRVVAMLILSLTNRFDQYAIASFLHNFKKLHTNLGNFLIFIYNLSTTIFG